MYKFISHRGIHNKLVKENTYESIILALNSDKYIGVEFDIRETKDNVFILNHNPVINNRLISNTNYNELPKYINKLKDILKIKSNKIFLIEIKNIKSFDKLIKLLNKYNNKNIYVMSFSNNIIKKMNNNNRKYKIGILNYVLNTDEFINKLDFICILNSLLNESIINNLKKLEIFSYGGINNKKFTQVYYIVDN